MNTSTKQVSVLAALALGIPLMVAGPAMAKGGDAVRDSGSCSGSSTWTLKAKPDSGVLEVELEVDSNHAGQTWKVRLFDNGSRFFAGSRTTSGPSGSFTVHRRTADYAGSDVIKARAVHGDEVCRGSVTV